MRYTIEATPNGYRLSAETWPGRPFINIDEEGGHGRIEELYAQTERVFDAARAEAVQQRNATNEVEGGK